ncbi:MAG: hypothetical protein Tsb0020_24480 [Haliangiales bacterium]
MTTTNTTDTAASGAAGADTSGWKVHQHDPIEELAENLWRVEGSLPKMALRRHMLVARDSDGRLLIHNGVALGEADMAKLEAFGTPTWLVVPNGWHRLDARAYKARYPQLQVLCPRGSRKKVEQVIPVDATYEQFAPTATLRLTHLRGLKDAEGVLEVLSEDGVTLVFNDTVFNQPHLPGVFGTMYKLLGQSGRPKVTLIAKLFMVKDKRELAKHLHELADIPKLTRVIPGHITPIVEDASATLHALARELGG